MFSKISVVFSAILVVQLISAHMMPPEMPKRNRKGLTKIQPVISVPTPTVNLIQEMKSSKFDLTNVDLDSYAARQLGKTGVLRSYPDRHLLYRSLTNNRAHLNVTGTAVCKDSQIASFMNYAMAYYIHDMNRLSKYVLDQLSVRKSGKWLVHAQIIAGTRQGPDWQTTTNGDVFTQNNWYTCYYHDTQTYILVLRLY